MHIEIDDQLLIRCMPQAEQRLLAQIPPERELHHSFSARFRWQMRALCRDERRSPRMRMMMRQLQTAAAVFALALLLAFGTLISVEAARVQMFHFFEKIYTEYTAVGVDTQKGYVPYELCLREPAYIPNGYFVESRKEYASLAYEVVYVNEKKELLFEQEVLGASTHIFDTENANVETIIIGTQEATLIEKNFFCQLYWHDDRYFYILSGNIDAAELGKMAESIIKK